MSIRRYPNIIVTGTPGCGKTSHSKDLVEALGSKYRHFSISDYAKEAKLIESYDETLDTSVLNEDKLLDLLEPELRKGGVIIDWHVCEIFPERLVDLVVVLRTDNSLLFDRLKARGYKDNKIQENLDAEIMEVLLQEAQESYAKEIVVVLASDTQEDREQNVERLEQWVENWTHDHPEGTSNELESDEEDSDEEDSDEDSSEVSSGESSTDERVSD